MEDNLGMVLLNKIKLVKICLYIRPTYKSFFSYIWDQHFFKTNIKGKYVPCFSLLFFYFFYKNTFYKNIFQLFIIQYIKPEIILYWGMHSQYKMETNFCFVFEHIFFVIFEIEGSMSLALVQFLFKQIKNTFYKNTFLLFMTQCRNCFVMGCEIPLHDEFGLFGNKCGGFFCFIG